MNLDDQNFNDLKNRLEAVNTASADERTLIWQNTITSGTKAMVSQIKELKYNTDRLIDEIDMKCGTHNSTVNSTDYSSYKSSYEYCSSNDSTYKSSYNCTAYYTSNYTTNRSSLCGDDAGDK